MQNYKQLQFFDTLALYFNCTHTEARANTTFSHVPVDSDHDVDVTIQPLGDNIYSLSPYPFDEPDIKFSYRGRRIEPQDGDTDLRASLAAAPDVSQDIRLCPAQAS